MENSYYKNIIGGDEEKRKKAQEKLSERFADNTISAEAEQYVIEKSPEDIEIIQEITRQVDDMIILYGGDPHDIPIENIFFLKPGAVDELNDRKGSSGEYSIQPAKMGVEKGESSFLLGSLIAHESFHAKSYKAFRVGNQSNETYAYRSGMNMFDRKNDEIADRYKVYFDELEEAIVAECTKRLCIQESDTSTKFEKEKRAMIEFRGLLVDLLNSKNELTEERKFFIDNIKYVPDPEYRIEAIKNFSDDIDARRGFLHGMLVAFIEDDKIEYFERFNERKKLYNLLDTIIVHSNGAFKDRESIFTEFAKVNFSGKFLPLARIIEGTLGEGSFRKMAEEFSTTHQIEVENFEQL